MSTPHRCPVCHGQGKVMTPPWVSGYEMQYTTAGISMYACHACSGRGIVWSPEPVTYILAQQPKKP